jgi:hypothetical protein
MIITTQNKNKMLKNRILKTFVGSMVIGLGLVSCDTGTKETPTPPPIKANVDSASEARKKDLQKIFFSIPSTVEMASLIKEKGMGFDKSILNSTDNVDRYTGESRQAVNLGIYGADLSYAAMFDEKQVTMNYFAAAQVLSRKLGVEGALTGELLERLERNQESRDSLLNIVSEAYGDLNGYLKENKRIEISALVVAGGWLEALNISCNYDPVGNPDIRKRVAEQKYSLKDLVAYFDKFGDAPALMEMKTDLKVLQALFDATQTNSGKVSSSKGQDGVVVIGGSSSITMNDETLNKIATKVKEIRTKFTSI